MKKSYVVFPSSNFYFPKEKFNEKQIKKEKSGHLCLHT